MRRNIMSGVLGLALGTSVALAGCSSGAGQTGGASAGPVHITLWHAMGGAAGKGIDELVNRFNASRPNIQVTAVYQGSYDDEFNKFKTVQGSDNAPSVMQVYDIGTRYMIDSGAAVPVQGFIDQDHYDMSDFEPNIVAYYTLDGKLHSMPFNSSNPILYYNKTAFKEAGLDPDRPPTTWDELEADARKLAKTGPDGKPTRYGMALAIYGWFFEQYLANQGALYADNGNGRQARATAAV
ncbi:MAG: ABC transporter substrate-binding protein, partial [Kyrpidia sp.]|nr:ABC transporter substrate-binding protein [Kyrpidia sp.]